MLLENVLNLIAQTILATAQSGAGAASTLYIYQPTLPEALITND